MAVFVRVFRLVMLFFNVYDSYKVLKLPPPSLQNKGKPSLRAMSQRKRDMKGCLAVWIVWSCFVTYERFVEAVVSLFIPFYDEVKSLILLFLIMTRARGAEPIYLHIIRPFLKPYTSTIDQLLDFARVVGDVVLGLATLPFIYLIHWWQRRFGTESECLDTETEASSSPLSTAPTTEFRPPVTRTSIPKPVKDVGSSVIKNRQVIPKRSSLIITGQKNGQSRITNPRATDTKPSDSNSTRHDLPTSDPIETGELSHGDEWREYPAFPSAYPPTPLIKHTQITAASVVSALPTLPPTISETSAHQDFRQSLLPPHKESNPNYVGHKSDDIKPDRVQLNEAEEITIAVMDVDGNGVLDESMEGEGEYESEDEFNITLRTPDAPLRILTSLGPPTTLSNEVSPLSLPSRSSALTTADGGSSLCTPSESTTSDASALPPTLASHKGTAHSISSTTNPRFQSSRVTARGTSVRMIRSTRSPVKRAVVPQRRPPRNTTPRPLVKLDSPEHENETSPTFPHSLIDDDEGEELTSKRRRVSLSPPNAVQVAEPVKRRVVRPTLTNAKTIRTVSTQKSSTFRTSPRPRTKTSGKPTTLSSRDGPALAIQGGPPSVRGHEAEL